MLKSEVRRFVTQHSPLSSVREIAFDKHGYDQATWRQLSQQLEIAGLLVPESLNGSGAGLPELAVACYELGRGLVPSPLLATALAEVALLASADGAAQADLLPKLAGGEAVGSIAITEPSGAGGAWIPHPPGTVARSTGSQTVLAGEKSPVVNAADADYLIVQARSEEGDGFYLVDARGAAIDVTPLDVIDPTRPLARVTFNNVPARRLAGSTGIILGSVRDAANLLLAAEACGAAEACLSMTAEYAKIRMAFGHPIGAFQGVKHRLADEHTAWALANATLLDAIRSRDKGSDEFSLAAAIARVSAATAYLGAARATIQIHGGIGFTWEHNAHLFYRNAVSNNVLFGSRDEQLAVVADRIGLHDRGK